MPWQNVWTAFNLISFWDAAEHTVFSFGYRLKVWRNHYCLKNSSMSEEIIKVWTWKKSSTSEFRLQAQCQKKSSMSKEIINSWRNYQCRSFGYRLNVWKNINVWRKHRFLKKLSMSGYRLQAQCLETINRFLKLNQTDHTFRCSS